jgi:TRAP-type C4-dicarboxylate transport system permease small subunit
MQGFVAAARALSRLGGIVAAGLIVAAVAVVCQMVVVRYGLGQTTIWQTDFVTFGLVAATFLGAPYVLMTRGHVNVDVLALYLGPRGRRALALVAAAIALGFALTLTWLAAAFWYEAWENRWRSDSMWRVRLWIPYAAMPVGLGLLSLQMLADLVDLLAGRAHPFGLPPEARGAAAIQVEESGT